MLVKSAGVERGGTSHFGFFIFAQAGLQWVENADPRRWYLTWALVDGFGQMRYHWKGLVILHNFTVEC